MDNKQEVCHLWVFHHILVFNFISKMIDIIETVYRGASKGRGLVVSPKGMPYATGSILLFRLDHSSRLLDALQILNCLP